jgi:hypothetical protein
VRYISTTDGKSSAQLISIAEGFSDLSVLVMRPGFIPTTLCLGMKYTLNLWERQFSFWQYVVVE